MIFRRLIEMHANRSYDPILKNKIQNLKGTPVFWNNESKAFLEKKELAGYEYLSFTLTGYLEIKTVSGVCLNIYGKEERFQLFSESEIVEGDYSGLSRIGITSFDVDYDPKLITFLKQEELLEIELKAKNGQLLKQELVFDYDSWDLENFIEILEGKSIV